MSLWLLLIAVVASPAFPSDHSKAEVQLMAVDEVDAFDLYLPGPGIIEAEEEININISTLLEALFSSGRYALVEPGWLKSVLAKASYALLYPRPVLCLMVPPPEGVAAAKRSAA